MTSPSDRRYTNDHEWIQHADGVATIGITTYAAEQLGDIVYVDLPEAGTTASAGTLLGEVESTKSVGEVLAPLDGEVVESNSRAVESPELVGEDPQGDGWLVKIACEALPEGLLSADEYDALLAQEG